ncbi:ectonucleoside triphosphate diphosphohydrolase 1 isoform X2 [Talpa occidentalis]|uniref:ectonucleoside triphosphate diphosphohydrolase 1 isoform X2 n=1 Tax=Talpa occidentalis TaxID=50954 RepID=UPI00188EDEE0|nr:ectonucleoside triphosphate diphosphohydrolase 1 isoform X2 [Talpa occidentalis]
MEQIEESGLKRFCSRNILIILGFTFIMAVIALITVGLTQNKPLPENLKYGIVLDAGSSHTSLYVYSWPAEKENDTGVVHQIDECKVKGPGISDYAEKTIEIDHSLEECMQRARSVIPQSQHEETPVYLGATAGMRLLRLKDERAADKVMLAVTTSLSKYPFDFQGAKIISGKEEGAFGWITINYLLGKFTQKLNWLNMHIKDKTYQTAYGALDLGGASTQITFVYNKPFEMPEENHVSFQLYGKTYILYTHSFLCYGKDQALLTKLSYDFQNSNGTIKDPCFHPGYERVMDIVEFYKSPCTEKYKLSKMDKLEILGTGNYEQCKQNIENQLFSNDTCGYTKCAFNGTYIPPVQGHFEAFSAYYYVMHFLNFTSQELPSENEVTRIMSNFCALSWNELKSRNTGLKEKYLSEYCFAGTYIFVLLNKFRFTDESWKNIHFVDQMEGTSIGWSLGYMLNLTNMIAPEQPLTPPLPHSTYVFLMIIFSLVLVTVVIAALFIFLKSSFIWKDMA